MVPMSKLLLLKRYNFRALEQSATADSTTPAVYGVEFTAMPASASGSSVNNTATRTSASIVLKGLHLNIIANNNMSQTMYFRVLVGWVRANVSIATVLAGTDILEAERDGGGEYKEDFNMHEADAQGAIAMFYKGSREVFGKVLLDKKMRLGPSGGAGALPEAKIYRKFLKFNRRINYENVTVTTGTASTAIGWKLCMIVAAYDATLDATSAKTVEISSDSKVFWYDCLD